MHQSLRKVEINKSNKMNKKMPSPLHAVLSPFFKLPFATAFLLFAQSAWPNVVGSDAQNFNPITSGIDFVTVQSSETLDTGVFNLGLFTNYAKNTFPYYDAVGGLTQRHERGNSLLGGDFNLGLGLGKNWDAGISFPVILQQQISDAASIGHYSSTGNTEIRINSKYRLFGNQTHGLAFVVSTNINRIAHNPYVGEGGGPIFNLELAADTTIAQMALGFNLGYRWRKPGAPIPETGIEPMPNQFLASAAASYFMKSIDTKVIAEILGAVPQAGKLKGATTREYSVLEALLGIKHDFSSNFSFQIGAGTGVVKGVSSPDLRVYSGINFSFGPLFGKRQVQTDPYYPNGKLVHYQRRRQLPVASNSAPRAVLASPTVVSEEIKPPVPLQPSKVAISKSPPVKIVPSKPLAPDRPAIVAQAEVEETAPSVAVETVQKVKVFDRGSYNHIVLNSIEFISGTNALKPESTLYMTQDLIPALKELNRRRPIGSIVVEGHTDSLGSPSSNLVLSRERAQIVADLLRAQLGLGIPVQPVGLGDTSPIADNGNYQGRALNRRVEFKLLYRRTSK
jgi:outer membrane protein OmpA-like peptidoglycan-associated protein